MEGSCDLYTTKAVGTDKKLYKNIEHSLESQYESLLRFSALLSPPEANAAGLALDLSRASPFGSLSQISSRRAFAYLIATLNASHTDYDFSNELKPSDFRKEKNLRRVMNTLDTTLYNLRPKPPVSYGSPHWSSAVTPASAATPAQRWSPRMWRLIDKEMDLVNCTIYSFSPEEELYDEEEGVIWNFNYFFFNKARKRVCYIYIKGLSLMNEDPVPRTSLLENTASYIDSDWASDWGASKRASYWLGDRGAAVEVESGWDEDDDDEMLSSSHKHLREPRLLPRSHHLNYVPSPSNPGSTRSSRSRSKSTVRAMSADIADSMEID